MREFVDALNSLGGKITIGTGTGLAFIMGLFVLNKKVDDRIDKRAERVAIDEVSTQHESCSKQWHQDTKDAFEESARLASMETKLDLIHDLILNGGKKN